MRISSTRSRQASGKATGKVTPINVLRQCHEISDVVVATDAGILSAGNLNAFDDVLCSGCDQVTTYDKTTLLIASHRMPLAKKKCERSRKTATNEEILAGWYRNGEVARSYKSPLKPGASQSIKTISGGLPGTRRGH